MLERFRETSPKTILPSPPSDHRLGGAHGHEPDHQCLRGSGGDDGFEVEVGVVVLYPPEAGGGLEERQ